MFIASSILPHRGNFSVDYSIQEEETPVHAITAGDLSLFAVTVHTPFGSLRAEVSGGLLHPPFSIVVDIQ